MAILNQFQQYSQSENTVTNNVLLMFSNLYEINPKYYEEYVNGLIEDSDNYQVIPNFRQQVGNIGGGIIDGHIEVKATKIIIETKLNGLEWIEKLVKYGNSFKKNEFSLLFHLSTEKYDPKQITQIEAKLSELSGVEKISFFSLTYEDLVGQLKELASNYQYEYYLQRLNENFESYCAGMNLMPSSNHILRAMACGQSFNLNVKYKFYFDLASRGYSKFNYLGIYRWKSVRYIGRVENMIRADWSDAEGLTIHHLENHMTTEQKERLIEGIKESLENGWEVNYGHRFFLLNDFEETDFKKISPGGIYRVRYFDIEKLLVNVPNKMKGIAEALRKVNWE